MWCCSCYWILVLCGSIRLYYNKIRLQGHIFMILLYKCHIYISSISKIRLQRHIFGTHFNNVSLYILETAHIATLIVSIGIFASDTFFRFQKHLKVSLQHSFVVVNVTKIYRYKLIFITVAYSISFYYHTIFMLSYNIYDPLAKSWFNLIQQNIILQSFQFFFF